MDGGAIGDGVLFAVFFVVVSHIDSDIEKRRSDCHLTQVTSAGLTAAEGALCAACHCLSSNLPIYIEKY